MGKRETFPWGRCFWVLHGGTPTESLHLWSSKDVFWLDRVEQYQRHRRGERTVRRLVEHLHGKWMLWLQSSRSPVYFSELPQGTFEEPQSWEGTPHTGNWQKKGKNKDSLDWWPSSQSLGLFENGTWNRWRLNIYKRKLGTLAPA